MDADFNNELKMEESIAALATAAGVSPSEYAYELLMKDDGKGFIYLPILNYRDGNLNFLEDLQAADDTVNSLSDGGAPCGTICDAASPTFMPQHWVRDRNGHRIAPEHAVKSQCRDTALLFGLDDRRPLATAYLADVSVVNRDTNKTDRKE